MVCMTSVLTLEPNFGCGGGDPVPARWPQQLALEAGRLEGSPLSGVFFSCFGVPPDAAFAESYQASVTDLTHHSWKHQ